MVRVLLWSRLPEARITRRRFVVRSTRLEFVLLTNTCFCLLEDGSKNELGPGLITHFASWTDTKFSLHKRGIFSEQRWRQEFPEAGANIAD